MKNKRGLTTLETCVLIIAVAAGLLAMRLYFKRAVQGNWRGNTDSFSDEQYEEGLTSEYVSPLTFSENKREALDYNTSEPLGDFLADKESDGKILHINNWGIYYDEQEHEEK